MLTQPRVILVAGIPAAGKTSFGRWLSHQHRFIHVELENRAVRDGLKLADPWRLLRDRRSRGPLIAAVMGLGPSVVLDWGFPPAWLPAVKHFGDCGAELWWLDGDRARAREEFIACRAVPVDCFDRQIAKIDRWWSEIAAIFGMRRLYVFDRRGSRMAPEHIWAKMTPSSAASEHRMRPADLHSPYLPKSTPG